MERIKQFFRSLRRFPTATALRYNPQSPLRMGVCAGLAYQLKIPVCIIRLAFLAGWLSHPISAISAIVIYFILMKTIPEAETPTDYAKICEIRMPWNLHRLGGSAGLVSGVCASIAYKIRIPVIAVRIGMIVLALLLPPMFYLYLIAWMVLPAHETPEDFPEVCKVKRKTDQQ